MKTQLAGSALASAAWFLFQSGAQAVSSLAVPQPVAGATSVTTSQTTTTTNNQVSTTLTINQGNNPKVVTSWNSFDIGSNASVKIVQPNGGVLVNNIGGPATTIDGTLSANASVYLINPAGIVVNQSGVINAGSLVLSTLPLDETQFKAGRTVFAADGYTTPGNIDNHGTLTVGQPVNGTVAKGGPAGAPVGGTVALIGAQVTNYRGGRIQADGGTAALAASSKVELSFSNDNLTNVIVSRDALSAAGVRDPYGDVKLAPAAAANLIATAVNQQGMVRAQAVSAKGSRIVLDGGVGSVNVGGQVDATGQLVRGGNIDVTADTVNILSTATLDASGNAATAQGVAGGRVRIGGPGATSANDLWRAVAVKIDPRATVHADAVSTGAGGSVIVDGSSAAIAGTLTARGGALAGDGGTIETSSPLLDVSNAQISARAPHGNAGDWLIDPPGVDIHIAADAPQTASGGGGAMPVGQVSANAIGRALSDGTSVTVRTNAANAVGLGDGEGAATGLISLDAPIEKSLGANGPNNVQLALQAYGDIVMPSGRIGSIQADANAGALSMLFQTGYGAAGTPSGTVNFYNATFTTNGGDFTVLAPFINMNAVTVNAGTPNGAAPGGNITLTAAGNPQSSIAINAGAFSANAGAIELSASGGGISISSDPYYFVDTRITPGPSTFTTGSGAIRLYGSNAYVPPPSYPGYTTYAGYGSTRMPAGVSLSNTSITAQGPVDVRGLGLLADATGTVAGVALDTTSISTSGGPLAPIAVSGQGAGGGAGIYARGSHIAGSGAQGDMILRAQGGASGEAFDLGAAGNTFSTGNNLIALPGGVNTDFTLAAARATPVSIGQDAGGFSLTSNDLAQMRAGNTMIVGGADFAGGIAVNLPTALSSNLTLENLGAGSAGIVSNGPIDGGGHLLTFASAGAVKLNGPVIADAVLLDGPGTFSLLNPANRVNTIAALGAGGVSFVNAFGFTIGALRAPVFGVSKLNAPSTVIDAPDTTVNGPVFMQALTGAIRLGGGMTALQGLGADAVGATGAPNVNLQASAAVDLVADGAGGSFVNAGAGNITATPGTWRIWADSWNGEVRGPVTPGGAMPNLYGCTYGSCNPNLQNNHFLYAAQPTVTVVIGDTTRDTNSANPAFTWQVTGLHPGDDPKYALNGTAWTAAGADAAPGKYAIGGAFTSPEGYRVNVIGGVLTVTQGQQPPPPPPPPPSTPPAAPGGLFGASGLQTFYSYTQRSFVYDSNLAGVMTRGSTGVCTGSNQPLASNLPADAAADSLAVEWRRVRSQPNLNSCIIVNRQHGCGDF
ncbi:S-layer family protein [Caballeronia sp. BR00000012568055]|uniref:beta strand repeat-containing protein n=1 Tax=Caballeronia sp. BR00000012568055 TaxID=2918761 RepID=UPI0023F94F6C|nr:filamentous hemagglutinin N-terminal domain-containing protein [Caballeronia sp. BR00000012568055]